MTEDIFKDVDWTKVEKQEDFDNEITPLQGDYEAEVKSFDFVESFNFYSLSAQVTKTIKGVDGTNRYLSRAFNLGESQYSTAEESREKLLKALKTIGVTNPAEAVGETVYLKVRPNKDKDGKVKRDKNDWPKHIVTIVTAFKGATDDANVTEGGSSNSPF